MTIPWSEPIRLAPAIAYGVICMLAGILIGIFIGIAMQYSEYHKYDRMKDD